MKRGVRYALIGFAVGVVFLVAAVGAAVIWSSYRQRQADRAWAESFGSMDDMLKRYPQAGNNPAALKLAEIVKPMGLSLLTSGSEREVAADAQQRLTPIGLFLQSLESKREDGTPVQVPEPVRAALSAMKPALDAAEAHINASGPIVWASDLTQGLTAPVPPLAGLRYLGTAILARSVESAQAGRTQAASASLRAFDRVLLSLEERHELITQLVVMALGLQRNSVLLQFGHEPVGAIGDADKRADRIIPTLRSMAIEAVLLPVTLSQDRAAAANQFGGSHPFRRLTNSVLLGFWMGDNSWRMHKLVSDMRSQDPCQVDLTAFQQRVESDVPWWNPVAGFQTPGLVRSWATAAAASLDNELTRIVVAARAKSGRAPAERALETHASHACPSLSWSVETLPEGGVLIGTRSGKPVDRVILTRSSFRIVKH